MKQCTVFKDIIPGLSMSWNCQEKKSRTFQEAWEPCTVVMWSSCCQQFITSCTQSSS